MSHTEKQFMRSSPPEAKPQKTLSLLEQAARELAQAREEESQAVTDKMTAGAALRNVAPWSTLERDVAYRQVAQAERRWQEARGQVARQTEALETLRAQVGNLQEQMKQQRRVIANAAATVQLKQRDLEMVQDTHEAEKNQLSSMQRRLRELTGEESAEGSQVTLGALR